MAAYRYDSTLRPTSGVRQNKPNIYFCGTPSYPFPYTESKSSASRSVFKRGSWRRSLVSGGLVGEMPVTLSITHCTTSTGMVELSFVFDYGIQGDGDYEAYSRKAVEELRAYHLLPDDRSLGTPPIYCPHCEEAASPVAIQ